MDKTEKALSLNEPLLVDAYHEETPDFTTSIQESEVLTSTMSNIIDNGRKSAITKHYSQKTQRLDVLNEQTISNLSSILSDQINELETVRQKFRKTGLQSSFSIRSAEGLPLEELKLIEKFNETYPISFTEKNPSQITMGRPVPEIFKEYMPSDTDLSKLLNQDQVVELTKLVDKKVIVHYCTSMDIAIYQNGSEFSIIDIKRMNEHEKSGKIVSIFAQNSGKKGQLVYTIYSSQKKHSGESLRCFILYRNNEKDKNPLVLEQISRDNNDNSEERHQQIEAIYCKELASFTYSRDYQKQIINGTEENLFPMTNMSFDKEYIVFYWKTTKDVRTLHMQQGKDDQEISFAVTRLQDSNGVIYLWDDQEGMTFYIVHGTKKQSRFAIKSAFTTPIPSQLYTNPTDPDTLFLIMGNKFPFRLTIFKNSVKSLIPDHLMFQDDIFSKLDLFDGQLIFYENYEKNSHLTKVKLRFKQTKLFDYLDYVNQPNNTVIINNIADFIKKESILEVFSYNVMTQEYILSKSIRHKEIMEMLFSKLQEASVEDMPYFLINCKNMSKEKLLMTPFDYAVEYNQSTNIQWFMKLITISDAKGVLYQKIIDKNIIQLFKLDINLKNYFESQCPFPAIDASYYPQYHNNRKKVIIPSDQPTLRDVIRNYESIVPDKILEGENTSVFNIRFIASTICYILINLCVLFLTAILIVPLSLYLHHQEGILEWYQELLQSIFGTISNERGSQEYDIEYFVVNLKQTLKSNSPLEFMLTLSKACSKDISYLEIDVIQTIIKHKWNAYTKDYYMFQFLMIITFIVTFVMDLIQRKNNDPSSEYGYGNLNIIGAISVSILAIHEFRQILVQRLSYFIDMWNYIDIGWIAISFIYLSLLNTEALPDSYESQENKDQIQVIQCMIVILTFLKLTFYLSIFDGLGFLVQMIQSVLKDLKNFMFFFAIFVAFCGAFMSIIMFNIDKDYPETAGMGSFIVAFRMSIGDFTSDGFASNENQRILTWGVWIVLMLFGNVIFMNFIIAVVSESYENCMSRMIAQTYKVKMDLILEREAILFGSDLDDYNYFPTYIVLRRPVNSEKDNQQQWQGFVKEIKISTEGQINGLNEDIKTLFKETQKQTLDMINKRMEEVEAKVQLIQNNDKIEALMKSMHNIENLLSGKEKEVSIDLQRAEPEKENDENQENEEREEPAEEERENEEKEETVEKEEENEENEQPAEEEEQKSE